MEKETPQLGKSGKVPLGQATERVCGNGAVKRNGGKELRQTRKRTHPGEGQESSVYT